ncbi:amidase [Corynebacterium variabile]|uniref:amidase n=1 Tax=Corynebacterium variabile TaxID=1727 RepID=UPI003FD1493A
MDNLNTAAQIRAAYREGSLTPVDMLDRTLAHIDEVNGEINAIVHRNDVEARQQAEASSERWAAGTPLGVLDGIPVSIKDSVRATGMPWRHGCLPNRDLAPDTADSPPAARLKEAGAVVFGKCAMPDFGMLGAGVSSLYGIVRNPWNLAMNTGGSSAGAGASLAAGIGSMSVGSDIAGSVRLPAAHCGLAALKPTQGRIPHLAPSTTRSAGPMARSVREVSELFGILTGPDPRDLMSLPGGPLMAEPVDLSDAAVAGLKVGLILDMGYGFGVHPEVEQIVRAAAQALRDAGAEVTKVLPVFTVDPYAALDRLFQVRALSEWAPYDETGRAEVLPAITEWCSTASTYSAVNHEDDLNAVAASAAHFAEIVDGFDVILSPVIPGLGFGAEMVGLNPDAPLAHCSFTCWFNQSGQPAAAVGFGMSHGVPVGIQIGGHRFDDLRVLAVAEWLEARRTTTFDWPTQPRDLPALPADLYADGYETRS